MNINDEFNPEGFLLENTTEIEKGYIGHAVDTGIEILKKSLNESGDDKRETRVFDFLVLFLTICFGLTFGAFEIVTVTLHKQFTVHRDNLVRIIICSILLVAISTFCFVSMLDGFGNSHLGTSDSFFVTGVFYFFLAFYILINGISHYKKTTKNKTPNSFSGASIFGFLKKDGLTESHIQRIVEPCFLICLGALFSIYNLIAGIPVFAVAISIVIRRILINIHQHHPLKPKHTKHSYSQKPEYH